jgi:hypothetical protein
MIRAFPRFAGSAVLPVSANASGCHGPIPFVETQRAASLQKAGPGSTALQRGLQSCLTRGRGYLALIE